ncbi:MAG: DNA polymerase III subunit delta [Acidimicrobiaceae bacterium]|nr:DNA polymerase III subunit delta [Acidimicrobiaceae bacterium]MDP6480346.1 DNA polymerase III subunit delta [Acidimicrobiales bacterium]MDP6696867.1 DNA polymerase III subunit delta [Acidimicrobiales bacterium]
MSRPPVLLISGDEALVGEALRQAVSEALEGEDRMFALEELSEENYRVDGELDLATLVDAAQTPPMLTRRRVVVARHVGRFGRTDEVEGLIRYLEVPLDTTTLILVWEKGVNPVQQRLAAVPKALTEAIAAAGGEVLKCSVGRGRDADRWVADQIAHAEVDLDGRAKAMIIERIGEDRTRVIGLLETLAGVFGSGHEVGAADVAPYLGDAGGVTPWELTDAIDSGDIAAAISKLHRTMGAGERHPLGVLAALHGHYARLLRLDGAGLADEKSAAAALGIKPYPAKKALATGRRLGSDRIAKAIRLLGDADLDLRGRSAWPPELVAEVLVARLASLSRR